MDQQLAKENKVIFAFSVIATVWLLAICHKAEASWMDLLRPNKSGACKEKALDILRSPEAHLAEGLRLASLDQYCEAMRNFQQSYIDAMDAETKNHAWFALAETAFYQRDYETQFERSEAYIKMNDYRGYRLNPDTQILNRSERLQYLLIKATLEMHQELGKKSPYISTLMGTSMEQQDPESGKVFYSVTSFMERWPNSIHFQEMKDLQQLLRDEVSGNVLSEGRRLWAQRQYVPAMARMKFVVSQGAFLKDFDVALYELILITEEFSFQVLKEDQVRSATLAEWTNSTETQMTVEYRMQLSQTLKIEAHKMIRMMREKLAFSPWTQKLKDRKI